MTSRLQSLCGLACACLLASSSAAQDPPEIPQFVQLGEQQVGQDAGEDASDDPSDDLSEDLGNVAPDDVPLPEEPMNPRDELFLAIELKDVAAAREALKSGAEVEISRGDPSPLATAALHNDLRMVALLLDSGGDPNAAEDSPLEEAIRNESSLMVELFMRAGAQVPAGAPGQEFFRLAQRGEAAQELSRILLDYGADAGQCLAAATAQARIELMKYCLSRGGDAGELPAEMNILGVAITGGDVKLVDQLLAGAAADRMLRTAFTDAVAAGRMELVQRALAAGAVPAFEQIEAAIEGGRPDICLQLLEQSAAKDPSVLQGGDAAALIQRAEDLGFSDVAAALRDKSGLSFWDSWLPLALGALLVAGLIVLLLGLRRGGGKASPAGSIEPPGGSAARPMPAAGSRPATARAPEIRPARAPAIRPVRAPENRPAQAPAIRPAAAGAARPVPAGESVAAPLAADPGPAAPAVAEPSPAATLPIGAIPMMPSVPQTPPVAQTPPAPQTPPVPQTPAMPGAAMPPPAVSPPAPAGAAGIAPGGGSLAGVDAAGAAPAATAGGSNVWQLAPEPVAETAPAISPVDPASAAAAVPPQPAIEIRMPEVDLARDADSVFAAARKAGSGETVRPDAPDRRQVVLVTPSRVTMLRSCPAPGSLAPEQLAAAAALAGPSPARNVAAIAYTDLDAIGDDVTRAIPFFDLLRKLGYLGHAVWIFEGHVSAMAAGCRDADVLIVDDGMMPYLPGNWRSVATRVMRGSEVHVFERKTGSLRRLS